ncbi:hypothetical protein BK025_03250 [Sodalis sp. TME1]|nr:hypothetical protein BK025_03250 [Sodalis sp. TME1]
MGLMQVLMQQVEVVAHHLSWDYQLPLMEVKVAVLPVMSLKAALYLILQQARSSLLMDEMVWVVLILNLVGLVEPLFRLQAVCLISVT